MAIALREVHQGELDPRGGERDHRPGGEGEGVQAHRALADSSGGWTPIVWNSLTTA